MVSVVPISEEHIGGYRDALDIVARERIYLAQTEARPLAWAREFVTNNIERNHAQFVAVEGDRVVGWCDVLPFASPGFGHGGGLGMGIVPEWRRRGVGSALLQATVEKAFDNGLSRIELFVYTSNASAIALYRRFGFVEEGMKRNARYLDGRFEDILLMALFDGVA